ncbi:uncharacterized protein M437DRAFT_81503 [Aureobasidium melanogenum CBS 110374]|uniref:Uncharacterized protein n=1 Tax=Aureobasidium melanogenum (strain CBS 110374) TaxID=1043003 RepID=A0A074W6X7_AURM1|nr:uncharacterized protein M437DRAFT_81503 [Aureobasidium melanogenum CBS 110374]KEQ65647.1 hypothetical protein M437DRAFT_81503 [Aureobasidium melanogenum CBS 110374]
MRSRHAVNQEEPPQHAEHSAALIEDSIQPVEEPLQHIEDPDTPLSSPRASNNQESEQSADHFHPGLDRSNQASLQTNDGLFVSRNQEVESDEEDGIPIKQLRPSRKRQLSPDFDSECHEYESGRQANTAPAATTSTTASTSAAPNSAPSTSTTANAAAITSSANNMPPSTRQINRRTTNAFASTATGVVLSCPVPNYKTVFAQSYTIDSFYKHMEDDAHFKRFYDKSSHHCPFGCEKGYFNEFALHRHVQQRMCEEAEDLSGAIKNCSMCSATSPDALGALIYLEQSYDQVLADANSPLHCTPCNVNFPTKELFWGHLSLVSGRGDSHHMVTKSRDLWYPSTTIVRAIWGSWIGGVHREQEKQEHGKQEGEEEHADTSTHSSCHSLRLL